MKINSSFFTELFKTSLLSHRFYETVSPHLEYHLFEDESHKKLLKYLKLYFDEYQVLPSLGEIAQTYTEDDKLLSLLDQIRETPKVQSEDILLSSFESFIRKARFVNLYNQLYDKFKKDSEEAIEYMEEESSKIANFSLRQTYYSRLFSEFEERQNERENTIEEHLSGKISWGIPALDNITSGGIDRGTSALLLGRSGKGKSTALRWTGIANARHGKKVLHFQFEGTKKACYRQYDSGWTGITKNDLLWGTIDPNLKERLVKISQQIVDSRGEIFIVANERFDELTIEEARDITENFVKVHGSVDLIIIDYIEIVGTNKSFTSERERRNYLASKCTNIAVEFDCAVLTATQANDIRPENYNNPDFFMTRSDISEFKTLIKPFSYFITLNCTDTEYAQGMQRMYVDKMRDDFAGQIISLCSDFETGRYYDQERTRQFFPDGGIRLAGLENM